MKQIQAQQIKTIFILGSLITLVGVFLSMFLYDNVEKVDYNAIYDRINREIVEETKILQDSIQKNNAKLLQYSKEIDKLHGKIKAQDKKLVEIERKYELQKNNINNFTIDDLTRESAKQLSE